MNSCFCVQFLLAAHYLMNKLPVSLHFSKCSHGYLQKAVPTLLNCSSDSESPVSVLFLWALHHYSVIDHFIHLRPRFSEVKCYVSPHIPPVTFPDWCISSYTTLLTPELQSSSLQTVLSPLLDLFLHQTAR